MRLPIGPAVTFPFTDIEGSTRLEQSVGSSAWVGVVGSVMGVSARSPRRAFGPDRAAAIGRGEPDVPLADVVAEVLAASPPTGV